MNDRPVKSAAYRVSNDLPPASPGVLCQNPIYFLKNLSVEHNYLFAKWPPMKLTFVGKAFICIKMIKLCLFSKALGVHVTGFFTVGLLRTQGMFNTQLK